MKLFTAALSLLIPLALAFQPNHHITNRRVLCRVSEKKSPGQFDFGTFFNGTTDKSRGNKNIVDQSVDQDSVPDKTAFDTDELKGRFDQFRSTIVPPDFTKMTENIDAIRENFVSGEFGQRGEVFVVAQLSLIALIVTGDIPFIGDLVRIALGPGLLLAGLAVIVYALQDMGESLSPWVTPNERTDLVTTGVFGYIRHPLYAGLLVSLLGLSFVTASPLRILLTAVLWKVLDEKSNYEEDELKQAFPGTYSAYAEQVPGKFFPSEWSLNLRFLNKDKL